jgi:hypothetical protein
MGDSSSVASSDADTVATTKSFRYWSFATTSIY